MGRDEPRRYLLAIGVDIYDDPKWGRLEKVPHEISRIVQLLTSPAFGMIPILAQASVAPHSEDLLTKLAEWAASPDRLMTDQLVIYWSGHGFVDSEQLLLILKNTRASTLNPAIRAQDLIERLLSSHSKLGPILLLLDVCYAGQGGLDMGARLGAWTRGKHRDHEPQLAIICAAQSRKSALQNAFADAFAEAIQFSKYDAHEHEPFLWVDKILDETNRRMPQKQQAEIFGKYRRLAFFRNTNYEPDPSKRQDAIGLIGRIRRFEAEYLVGKDGPVPFGGRQAYLDSLDRWLDTDSAAPRLLITAPAGRGKSALLVAWIESLRAHGIICDKGWQLVFVPISLRFETSLPEIHLQLLALLLAQIAGVKLEKPATDPAGFYADQSRELLYKLATSEEKHILIVLDGLDEAPSPDTFSTLLPRSLPRTLRVVASARLQTGDQGCSGWLNRLDWPQPTPNTNHHLELPTLEQDQVADVLVKMGAPIDVIGSAPALVTRLTELTEGEPLLLRLYAEDLWRKTSDGAAITQADLDQLKPGFAPYFARWLELQERQWRQAGKRFNRDTIDPLLAILGVAKGPLCGPDLLALLKSIFPERRCPSTSQSLLEPLRRFVIGDGQELPYVLSHPKLGEYIKKQRCYECIPKVEKGFVDWGRGHVKALNSGLIQPKGASAYALQFLRSHFEDEKAPADTFMLFVEDGWRRAWEYFEGGQRGFSTDIHAAWNALRRDGPVAHLGAQWRCVLALSSIRSLGLSMPGKLIVAAVEHGVLAAKQGQYFAELIKDDKSSACTLAQLALQSSTTDALRQDVITVAIQRATLVRNEVNRVGLLENLLNIFLSTSGGLQSDKLRKSAVDTVWQASQALTDPGSRSRALAKLAPHLPTELLEGAFEVALAVPDEWHRFYAMIAFAPRLPQELLDDATKTAQGIHNKGLRSQALAALARRLPPKEKRQTLVAALDAAQTIADKYGRSEAMAKLALHLPPDLIAATLKATRAIRDEAQRSWALLALAPHLPPELLPDALDTARSIRDEWRQASALAALTPHLPSHLLADVLDAAQAFTNEHRRSLALTVLTPHLPAAKQKPFLTGALEGARTIADPEHRFRALTALVPHLPPRMKRQALAYTLDAALAVEDQRRSSALAELAPHLPPDLLAAALDSVRAIDGRGFGDKSAMLAALAPNLPPQERRQNSR